MPRLRYHLLLKIASKPKAFTYGAGVLVALLLMVASVSVTIWLDQTKTARLHQASTRLFSGLFSETDRLLDYLVKKGQVACDLPTLRLLNTRMLQTRYIREVGVMDEDRRLICSTALGPLKEPIKGNYPVHTSRSGHQILNAVPLTMADKQLLAMLIQRPPSMLRSAPT